MNGVGVFLGPISDGAAGTAVNLKRSGKLSQGGSTPPKENEIRGPRPAAAGWGDTTAPWMTSGILLLQWQAGERMDSSPVRWSGAADERGRPYPNSGNGGKKLKWFMRKKPAAQPPALQKPQGQPLSLPLDPGPPQPRLRGVADHLEQVVLPRRCHRHGPGGPVPDIHRIRHAHRPLSRQCMPGGMQKCPCLKKACSASVAIHFPDS